MYEGMVYLVWVFENDSVQLLYSCHTIYLEETVRASRYLYIYLLIL